MTLLLCWRQPGPVIRARYGCGMRKLIPLQTRTTILLNRHCGLALSWWSFTLTSP